MTGMPLTLRSDAPDIAALKAEAKRLAGELNAVLEKFSGTDVETIIWVRPAQHDPIISEVRVLFCQPGVPE